MIFLEKSNSRTCFLLDGLKARLPRIVPLPVVQLEARISDPVGDTTNSGAKIGIAAVQIT
jgi:hypothetical protein